MKYIERDEAPYEAIYNKYPLLFEYDPDKGSWNIEIGPMIGWIKIMDNLCEKITDILLPLSEEDRLKFHLDQIKEKMGRLTIYASFDRDSFEAKPELREVYNKIMTEIHLASNTSEKTCEVCGETGVLKNKKGWVKTLCEQHYQDWLK